MNLKTKNAYNDKYEHNIRIYNAKSHLLNGKFN